MKTYIKQFAIITLITASFAACKDDSSDDVTPMDSSPDFSGMYQQDDQMGRPAINTVFINPDSKNAFNTTVPSAQGAQFGGMIETNLVAVSPAYDNAGDENALGLDAPTFASVLAADVLNVSLTGTTTFYDGTNVLTGRNLTDDVIDVELLLIFGGEDFMENPGLTSDNVGSNDKAFLNSFPYLASPW